MITAVASIVIFFLLIWIHELGHFLAAKKVGIVVKEFSIGFGPLLAKTRKKETQYSLRLIPLGGFVKMKGMDLEEGEEEEDDRGSFTKATVWQRALVLFAGSGMNLLLAVVLLALVFSAFGIPKAVPVIDKVQPNMPAAAAGFKPGDKIIAVNETKIASWEQLVEIISKSPGKPLTFKITRENLEKTIVVTPRPDDQGLGKIGIVPRQEIERKPIWEGLYLGFVYTFKIIALIVVFLGKMLVHQAPMELGGPVRVVSEIGRAAQFGLSSLVQLAAFLSINLGIFNLLPIPALDGSRIMFVLAEALRGKPIDPEKENFIHLIGFGLLLLLMLIITYKDIISLIGG
ncbi:RIP metalloprotease RseP [Carboxydothermus hydrogenoformans]|uniref:Zinc metalloprotease n=1 Tax=Carboxydothermus hydrogenoformans (strain ATCC BAA-161 / DSM 6008 / Z-2901) TaxID=246194 RepID=Q3AB87_CARHZ|nr:RIP metalloprotease RseP [Carboxydothermus hydrogenoformans]ABB13927.1 putative membrane-associated zinc metalloprotease [Carboxydothermus hydrogenoformans Z-2901]